MWKSWVLECRMEDTGKDAGKGDGWPISKARSESAGGLSCEEHGIDVASMRSCCFEYLSRVITVGCVIVRLGMSVRSAKL